jgi:hypothetical protein
MATYSEIREWIKQKHGYNIETCWIAHAKELCGVEVKRAVNRQNTKTRKNPCPKDKLEMIKEAFRKFGMI